mgnify:CR=1 FL=1
MSELAIFGGKPVIPEPLPRYCSVGEAEAGVAGAFCGLTFILAMPWLGGAGGKLGTLAFGSTLAYLGLRETVRRARARLRRR